MVKVVPTPQCVKDILKSYTKHHQLGYYDSELDFICPRPRRQHLALYVAPTSPPAKRVIVGKPAT